MEQQLISSNTKLDIEDIKRTERTWPWSRMPLRIDTRAVIVKCETHKGGGSHPSFPVWELLRSGSELDLAFTKERKRRYWGERVESEDSPERKHSHRSLGRVMFFTELWKKQSVITSCFVLSLILKTRRFIMIWKLKVYTWQGSPWHIQTWQGITWPGEGRRGQTNPL